MDTSIVTASITALGSIVSAWVARKKKNESTGRPKRRGARRWALALAVLLAFSTIVIGGFALWPPSRIDASSTGHVAPLPPHFVDSDETLTVTAKNLTDFEHRLQVGVGTLIFEGVHVTVPAGAIYLANAVELRKGAVLAGPEFSVIAGTLRGGVLSADGAVGPTGEGPGAPGQDGQPGGRLLVAAGSVVGTRIEARGGSGGPGVAGLAGSPGGQGGNGVDGRCGPGMLGQFRGSTSGGNGSAGGAGGDGGEGGSGGRGGVIYVLTSQDLTPPTVVAGGEGGAGGPAGKGGAGGPGGKGGSGCAGAGGHQPTRPNGNPGPAGADGKPGLAGSPGPDGELWIRRTVDMDQIHRVLQQAPTTEDAREELIKLTQA